MIEKETLEKQKKINYDKYKFSDNKFPKTELNKQSNININSIEKNYQKKSEIIDKKERNKLIDGKSKSLEKISFNKYRNNEPDIKIEKNINNKLITSKSYKNIEENKIDNKKEKEENKKIWRFSVKNKENEIDNKIEPFKGLKETESFKMSTKEKTEKQKLEEENKKKEEIINKQKEEKMKFEKIKEKIYILIPIIIHLDIQIHQIVQKLVFIKEKKF